MGKKDNEAAGEFGRDEEESRRTRLRVMNERFESRLDETVFEGVRDEAIYHGMKFASATALQKPFADICFCDETQVISNEAKMGVEYGMMSVGVGKYMWRRFFVCGDTFQWLDC